MRTTALLVAPPSLLVALDRPAALVALLVLAVFVAAVARVGLWLLDDLVQGNPDRHAARAGLGAFTAGVVVATSALLIGPPTVLLVVPATALVALWFRPGRRSSFLGVAARRAPNG